MATDDEMMLIQRELVRILGDAASSVDARIVVLPLPTPKATLRFLSQIAPGTSLEELERLAGEFASASPEKPSPTPFAW